MQHPVPLSEFAVPGGQIVITMELTDAPQFAAVIPSADVENTLRQVEANFGIQPAGRKAIPVHLFLRNLVEETVREGGTGDPVVAKSVGAVVLWLMLNYPGQADAIRSRIAARLRTGGRALVCIGQQEMASWLVHVDDLSAVASSAPPSPAPAASYLTN